MIAIFKLALEMKDNQTIQIQSGAEILSARGQHNCICIWFRCDPDAPKEPRDIAIIGTGHEAPPFGNAWRFIRTVALYEGDFIFHVFEKLVINLGR